jgi:hypothetical protein
MSPARTPCSGRSRVRITSPYMSKGIGYRGHMVMNRGTSAAVSICQTEQNLTAATGRRDGTFDLVDDASRASSTRSRFICGIRFY